MEEKSGTSGGREEVACPFCDSTDTELISLFGSQLLTSQYYCRHCHTGFEAVRTEERVSRDDVTPKEAR